jgi:hypothetical protein
VQPCVQPFDQARARDQLRPGGGDIQLGSQKRAGHWRYPWYGMAGLYRRRIRFVKLGLMGEV